MRRTSVFPMLLFAGAALLATSGCSRDRGPERTAVTPAPGTATEDKAMVRVVNADPELKEVDAFADNQPIFDNVAYKEVTAYKEMKDNRFTFAVRPDGQTAGDPLAENSEGLGGGDHYTFVVLPEKEMGKATLMALKDKNEPAEEGKARVRVVNASRDAGEIDIFIAGNKDPLVSGLNFQSESFYSDVAPGNVALQVRREGQRAPLLTVKNVNLEAGKIYTFVLAGRGRQIEAIRIEDSMNAPHGARTGSQ